MVTRKDLIFFLFQYLGVIVSVNIYLGYKLSCFQESIFLVSYITLERL